MWLFLLCFTFCVFPFVLFLLCFYFRVFPFLTFFFTIQSFIFKLSFLSILCLVPFLHTWLLSPLPFHLFPFSYSFLIFCSFSPFHLSFYTIPFSFSFLLFLSPFPFSSSFPFPHFTFPFLLFLFPFSFFFSFLLTYPYFIFSLFNLFFNSFTFPFIKPHLPLSSINCYPHTRHFKSL